MMVIPRSRSRSMLSITRSATCWLARYTPPCRSNASTSVVLPWSTWATMARLRRSGLAICDGFLCKDIFPVYLGDGSPPVRLTSAPMRAALASTLALCLTLSAPVSGQATRTVSMRGTPAQPGSVLELTLHGIEGDRAPEGTVFGRPLVFMPSGEPFTWRTLVGVDVL